VLWPRWLNHAAWLLCARVLQAELCAAVGAIANMYNICRH